MTDPSQWGFETRQMHAGQVPDSATGARALPIYQTTSYVFNDTAHAANLFALKEFGNIYTRIMNPTQDAVEQRIAALEGGVGGAARRRPARPRRPSACSTSPRPVTTSSSSSALYGGTVNLLKYTFPKLGDRGDLRRRPGRPGRVAGCGAPQHEGVLRRDDRQPQGRGARHRRRGRRGARGGRPARRRQHDRDAVPHPPARARRRRRHPLGDEVPRWPRHVDRRRHRRRRHLRLRPGRREVPELQHARGELPRAGVRAGPRRRRHPRSQPGLHPQGPRAAAARPRLGHLAVQRLPHRAGPRDAQPAGGAARRERPHGRRRTSRSTRRSRPCAGPRSTVSPARSSPTSYAPKGAGAVLAFEIRGGLEAGQRFVEGLSLHSHVANIGDVRSLAIHPASTTHSQGGDEDRLAAGVTPGLVRLAVGIESIEDILADLDAGFAAAQGREPRPTATSEPSSRPTSREPPQAEPSTRRCTRGPTRAAQRPRFVAKSGALRRVSGRIRP